MTTKVMVQIAHMHMPIVVEAINPDGTVDHLATLRTLDQFACDYVSSGKTLRVREMSIEEKHNWRP